MKFVKIVLTRKNFQVTLLFKIKALSEVSVLAFSSFLHRFISIKLFLFYFIFSKLPPTFNCEFIYFYKHYGTLYCRPKFILVTVNVKFRIIILILPAFSHTATFSNKFYF